MKVCESGNYKGSGGHEGGSLLESNQSKEVASHRVPRGEVRRPEGSRDSEGQFLVSSA